MVSDRNLTFAVTLLSCSLSATPFALSGDQQTAPTPYGSRVEDATALPAEPATAFDRAVREARSRFFNDRYGTRLEDMPIDAPPPMIFLDTLDPPPAFPFGKDPVVVLGKIVDRQSDLSQDRTTVYTLYKVMIEQMLVCPAACVAAPISNTITLVMEGGAVKLPTGRVLRTVVSGAYHPIPGNRYVIFLHPRRDLDAFGVSKLWLIQDGRSAAVFSEDKPRSEFIGLDETRFLELLKVSARNAGLSVAK